MLIKVRCQTCGKLSVFAGHDVGLVALCVACGARFTVPGDPADTQVLPAIDEVAAAAASGNAAGNAKELEAAAAALTAAIGAPTAPTASPAPAPPPGTAAMATRADAAPVRPGPVPPQWGTATATKPRSASHPIPVAALVLTMAAAIAFVILYVNAKPSWESREHAKIRDLRAAAVELAEARKYREAYDAYRRIDDLVAGRSIRDAQLRGEVDQARGERDALLARVFGEAGDRYASVTLPQPTEPPGPDGTIRMSVEGRAPSPAAAAAAATAPSRPGQDWPAYAPTPRDQVEPATRPATATATATTRPAVPAPSVAIASAVEPRANRRSATAPALPRPPITVRPRADGDVAPGVTDEAIGQAIQRGVTNLLEQFRGGRLGGGGGGGGGGADGPVRGSAYPAGLNALCVYALLQASLATGDERLNLKGPVVRALVDRIKAMPVDTGPVTYARGIRATALALLNRPEDKTVLTQDVNYLLNSHVGGAYSYSRPGTVPAARALSTGGWDNSNSQYGLLGVWSGAEVGAEVNATYWQAVENHWVKAQLPTGAWDYTTYRRRPDGGGFAGLPWFGGDRGEGRLSMTVAGVASLLVTHDYLDAPKIGSRVGRPPFSPALARGLEYLESGNNAVNLKGGGGYTLYGLERVGLASGFKFFGAHDWYRELAAQVIANQAADGSWGTEVETAYHLLFLARGRHPILMNKLRYDGSWANRPRDVANLARFGTRELERPLNWQVVPADRPWTDWMDAPILYVASHKREALEAGEVDKIRSFIEAGGMLLTQADGGTSEANAWANELAKKLFPAYEMRDLPEDHDVYGILYKPSDRPPLRAVSNGSRLLMLHSSTDITQHWQMRADRTRRGLFELGLNVFLYASGKGDLRNRLSSPVIPEAPPATGGRIAVARVRYPSNWDPEPGAWPRFARYFQRETGVALDVAPTDLKNLHPLVAPFAHWTGTAPYTPTDAEIAALRRFVEGGGVLLVEPTGGSGDFYESAKAALLRAFPEARPQMIPKTHPMLTASGPAMDDLSKPLTRAYVKARNYGTGGRIDAIIVGRGKVILSPLDLTTGLLGCNVWGVLGFDKDYALKLAKNIVLWSATGMPEEP
jgi:hypothetical protein